MDRKTWRDKVIFSKSSSKFTTEPGLRVLIPVNAMFTNFINEGRYNICNK